MILLSWKNVEESQATLSRVLYYDTTYIKIQSISKKYYQARTNLSSLISATILLVTRESQARTVEDEGRRVRS